MIIITMMRGLDAGAALPDDARPRGRLGRRLGRMRARGNDENTN